MGKISAASLRELKKEELVAQLGQLKQELAELRVAKVTGQAASKLSKIRVVRKGVARVLTVINQKSQENLRKFYQDRKFKPKDLRMKQTRAIRRRLSHSDAKRKTLRQRKQDQAFPQRKYALKL
eukprot:Hpha_TRINITY_DN16106_c1_g10::TRINITY_DN16106_c1_g10_i1::g.4114::m.4114/K02918/RP-L35e, RPL35; large subunit ribosomal protein L35e